MDLKNEKKPRKSRSITTLESLILLAVFIALMVWNALAGKMGTSVGLLYCAIIGFGYGIIVLGLTWTEMFDSVLKVVGSCMPVMYFLFCAGMVQAAWIASGTVPYVIYIGLKLISPSAFLVIAFLVCFVISVASANAWSTVATVGLALGSVGTALGIPLPIVTGAIVAGSWGGDRWSPLVDTCLLCAASAETDAMKQFKSMIPATVISTVLATIIYFVMGLSYKTSAGADLSSIEVITSGLSEHFNFGPGILLLLPIVVVIVGAILKLAATPLMFIGGVLTGTFMAVIFQKTPFTEASSIFWYGYASDTGNQVIDELLTRGGAMGLVDLTMLLFAAFLFAGVINKLGILGVLLDGILGKIKNVGTLVLACTLTTAAGVLMTSSVFVSVILNSTIYKEGFKKKGYDTVILGRTLVEGVSYTGAYVPWSGGGILISASLGVPGLVWVPYCFAGFIASIANIVFAYLGWFMPKAEYDEDLNLITDEPKLEESTAGA